MYISGTLLTSFLLAQLSFASPGRYRPKYRHHPEAGEDKLGAVASESSICSNIGTDILKEGGNAADSLIATVFCVGVIGMVSPLGEQSCRRQANNISIILALLEAVSC